MAALAADENFNRRGVELPEEGISTVPARIGYVYAHKRSRTGTEACPYSEQSRRSDRTFSTALPGRV